MQGQDNKQTIDKTEQDKPASDSEDIVMADSTHTHHMCIIEGLKAVSSPS